MLQKDIVDELWITPSKLLFQVMEDDLKGITILREEDFNLADKVEVGRGGCAKTFCVDHLGEKRALKKPNRNTTLCAREVIF